MTDTEINIAIAEACGWEREKFISPLDNRTELELWKTKKGRRLITKAVTPNYCHDLNAMHEVERELICNIADYEDELSDICHGSNINMICATARQRAEAFLRTIGKWKE